MIDLSPEEFRTLGYRAIDLLADQLGSIRRVPVRRPVPEELRRKFLEQPLPEHGVRPGELIEIVARDIFRYPLGNGSPRYFGWVNSPAAPLAVLADLLASGLNSSVAGGDHAATYVEHATLNWLKALLGYPADAGGILASGGSVGNLIGLAVMKSVKTAEDVRAATVVYTSTEAHSCIEKAVELLGIGRDNLRKIPVNEEFQMDLDQLASQIDRDRAQGLRPVAVAATAGTVNTGAIDPLDALADLCARENLWFHVDGAYGAPGILAREIRHLYRGFERADSLVIDPHKWLYMPLECGCALVRDSQAMRNAFSLVPPYLRDAAAPPWFSEFGIQQSRGFRALKLWMTLQQIGTRGYRELIERDIALARFLVGRIRERRDFELLGAGPLSIVCFRYAPAAVDDLDTLNRNLLQVVQREGRVFLTSTELRSRLALRACIINFRTCESDLDLLLDVVAAAGEKCRSGA